MAIGSDSVVVGFLSVRIRRGFRRNSSEADNIRVGSGQILSGFVEFRRNLRRIPIKPDADPIVSDRIYRSD